MAEVEDASGNSKAALTLARETENQRAVSTTSFRKLSLAELAKAGKIHSGGIPLDGMGRPPLLYPREIF